MSFLSKAFKSIRKAAEAVVRSPIAKAAAGGLAIVCPPAGAGAMAALAVSDKVMAATRSKDPKRRAEAQKVIANTVKAARTGHAGARHGAMMLMLAKRRRRIAEAMHVDKLRRAGQR